MSFYLRSNAVHTFVTINSITNALSANYGISIQGYAFIHNENATSKIQQEMGRLLFWTPAGILPRTNGVEPIRNCCLSHATLKSNYLFALYPEIHLLNFLANTF